MKPVIYLVLIVLTMGFRPILDKNPWQLTPESPNLFVKLCDDAEDYAFDSYNVPDDDDWQMNGERTVRELVQSVVDDYNSINESFLNLVLLPPEGEAAPDEVAQAGDTYSDRIIQFCVKDYDTGAASIDWSGNKAKGCEIEIGGYDAVESKFFLALLTHEMAHCLGMLHPHETRDSPLSYFALGTTYRLQLDDKMGISYLYPQTDQGSLDHTFGMSCEPSQK